MQVYALAKRVRRSEDRMTNLITLLLNYSAPQYALAHHDEASIMDVCNSTTDTGEEDIKRYR